jgi:hypothetical protein
MDVNDDTGDLNARVVPAFFASKLAPAGLHPAAEGCDLFRAFTF